MVANLPNWIDDKDAAMAAAWRRARRRVRMQRGWYIHALVYLIVIGSLWLAWAVGASGRYTWPLPPTLGWGLGLAIHGIVAFLAGSQRAADWERRQVEAALRAEGVEPPSGYGR